MVGVSRVKRRIAQRMPAAGLPLKAASTNKPGDEYVKNIATLSDRQIRNENWAYVRRTVYIAILILVITGFYLLWNRDEQCSRLNKRLSNSTV